MRQGGAIGGLPAVGAETDTFVDNNFVLAATAPPFFFGEPVHAEQIMCRIAPGSIGLGFYRKDAGNFYLARHYLHVVG